LQLNPTTYIEEHSNSCHQKLEEKKAKKGLSRKDREHRMTLYLNEKRVDEYFIVSYGDIDEYVTTKTKEGKIEAGIKMLYEFVSSFRMDKGEQFKAKIKPIDRADLVEYYAAEGKILVDLSYDVQTKLTSDHILKYKGECNMTEPGDPVSDRYPGLSPEVARKIQDYRIAKEIKKKKLFPKDEDPRTAVWTATPSGKKTLASILSMTYCSPDIYRHQPRGLLGKLEEETHDIVYISPFWVWA
jgi:hypothetical protein